jgi:hypothetical protein
MLPAADLGGALAGALARRVPRARPRLLRREREAWLPAQPRAAAEGCLVAAGTDRPVLLRVARALLDRGPHSV